MIPDSLDALLRRSELSSALKAAGYDTAPGTLANLASRGEGPPYVLFGRIAKYRWGDGLEWARSRVTLPRGWRKKATGTVIGGHVVA
jgi:hypothetical protein